METTTTILTKRVTGAAANSIRVVGPDIDAIDPHRDASRRCGLPYDTMRCIIGQNGWRRNRRRPRVALEIQFVSSGLTPYKSNSAVCATLKEARELYLS